MIKWVLYSLFAILFSLWALRNVILATSNKKFQKQVISLEFLFI